MFGMPTMHTLELVPSPISPVPSTAYSTELRGFPGVLPFQPDPLFLTFPFNEIRRIGIKPMRQPPIKPTRKLSPCTTFHMFQVLDAQLLDTTQIKRLEGVTDHRFDIGSCVLPATSKLLDKGIWFICDLLAIREDKTSLVVGIHPEDFSDLPLGGFGLLQQEVYVEIVVSTTEPNRLADLPAVTEHLVDVCGALCRNDHSGGSRADQFDSVIECPIELRNGYEMRAQCGCVSTKTRFPVLVGVGRSDRFLRLFGKGLSKSGRDFEPVSSSMYCREVCESSREVLSLPKEIYKVLRGVVAQSQKIYKFVPLSCVQIVDEDATGASHSRDREGLVRLTHLLFLLQRLDCCFCLLPASSLPVKTSTEGRYDGHEVFHKIGGLVFSDVDDFDPKRRKGYEPAETESSEPVFVLYKKHIEILSSQKPVEFSSLVVNARADFCDHLNNLPAFCCSIPTEPINLRSQCCLVLR